ncbi:response regulator [Sulfitobacter sp. HNIBRBA3233]|uniref:response regulator n=1 Tax=Sulfitobacter marinivivus TaxID=3158558 RepID=UPI0032DFC6C4
MAEKRILIIDDSMVDRMILKRAFGKLADSTVSLSEVDNALAAVEALDDVPFDALFLDINMPGYNGFHVLRAAREKFPSPPPLVFMYSSSEHPDDVSQAYAEGADEYICKPNDLLSVVKMVANCTRKIDDMLGAA